MSFKIVRNDITKMHVDAVVNTANEAPTYGTGVDYAIYKAAGEVQLLEERRQIGFLKEGDVVITSGYQLPAKYIIHAVSPRYIDGESREEDKLRSCYRKSLALALENHCQSVAFPLISTGGFGYPKEEAMRIAVDEINAFLLRHNMLIYLVVFDTASTKLGLNLYPELEAYIDSNYVSDKREEEYGDRMFGSVPLGSPHFGEYQILRDEVERSVKAVPRMTSPCMSTRPIVPMANIGPDASAVEGKVCAAQKATLCEEDYSDFYEENESALKERMKHMSDTFQEYLLYLIAQKGLNNAEVYKNAIITKQLFSKIKLNPQYHPDKATAMRLCVGARLNLDETKDLLARAGYALSPCDKRDIIFSFFLENEVYDMIEIDIALEEHGLPCFIE